MAFSSRFNRSASAEAGCLIDGTNTPNPTPPSTGSARSSRPRSYLLRGLLTFLMIGAAQGALNASTGVNGTADYLQWLLKNEEKTEKPASEANAANLAPVRSAQGGSDGVEHQRPPMPHARVVIERVRRNDTLAALMERQKVPRQVAREFVERAKPLFDLDQRLTIDTPVKLTFGLDNQLIGMGYSITRDKTLRVVVDSNRKMTAFLEKVHPLALPEKLLQEETAAVERQGVAEAMLAEEEALLEDEILAFDGQGEARSGQPREKMALPYQVREVTIRPGDNLSSLLAQQRIPSQTSLAISKAARPVFDLARQLSPGKTITLTFAPNGDLTELLYPVDFERTFLLTGNNDKGFTARIEKKRLEVHLESITGTIRNERSLFLAGKSLGLSKSQAIKLSGLFEWDIDFAHELQSGDHFTIVQEGLFFEGKRVRDGDIVAAEFTNHGKLHRVVRYIDPKGNVDYYDKDGNNVRKMFIRAPMDFTRISSHFSKNRMHPILGYGRAHQGVDYAAPTGTPVRAAGDGRIEFIGYKGGYGKFITVRHSEKYSTAYGHLNSFADELRPGSQVRQGEIIGRVGSTGLATGPHLHYEVHVRDVPVNPLTIQMASRGPLDKKLLPDFRKQSAQLFALLDKRKAGDVTHLAQQLTQRTQTR
ncbi:MAG: peptidoglycan DD-metalloendopeptidase family protein [Magnetococcales bacterium]|nr:peptidoglycan DD-metalloendopeptidase family protein [Magnetococcales bacterium]